MLGLGALSFTAAWVLAFLAVLPALWWLLRLTPPSPRRLSFPAVRFLLNLDSTEDTSATTPWWVLLLRLLIAALIIFALAGPRLGNPIDTSRTEPLVLVIDDGWAAAPEWQSRLDQVRPYITGAAAAQREVILALTSTAEAQRLAPAEAGVALARLTPHPWTTNRESTVAALNELDIAAPAQVIWLTDGLSSRDPQQDELFLDRLKRLGRVTLLPPPAAASWVMDEVRWSTGERGPVLTVPVTRLGPLPDRQITVELRNRSGQIIMTQDAQVNAGQRQLDVAIPLASQLAGEAAQLSIQGVDGAAAIHLLDTGSQYRAVGLVSGNPNQVDAPLLQDLYYVERALSPSATLIRGSFDDVLSQNVPVIAMAGFGRLASGTEDRLTEWVEDGGLLIRFAGPNLAEGSDRLVPVALRQGGRALGGTLSWTEPQSLAPFAAESPFAGLAEAREVTVSSQVLAVPGPEVDQRTWATLTDGTPLVTGAPRGQGWVVLFHVTANAAWSDLPLSGAFVDMLTRLLTLSTGGSVAADPNTVLQPDALLDGFGRLGPPGDQARPLTVADITAAVPSAIQPPGLYTDGISTAVINLGPSVKSARALDVDLSGVDVASASDRPAEHDLRGPLYLAAFVLLILDGLISLGLRGLLPAPRFAAGSTAALVMILLLPTSGAAQGNDPLDQKAIAAVLQTRLAYVETGVGDIDQRTASGLSALTQVLANRTSAELAPPTAVNPERDELSVYPLLYYRVASGVQPPSEAAADKLNEYMRQGGMILFDAPGAGNTSGPGATTQLRSVLQTLDIPPLTQAPDSHVIGRSFYLLPDYAGRTVGAPVWVAQAAETNDGVSSVIIGSNDWAGAWARDSIYRPLYPVVPGGERQREMAYRFGVNVVMYALTGNYKADQVHLPAIMERLTQ